jgi:hypothetical protein
MKQVKKNLSFVQENSDSPLRRTFEDIQFQLIVQQKRRELKEEKRLNEEVETKLGERCVENGHIASRVHPTSQSNEHDHDVSLSLNLHFTISIPFINDLLVIP